ncbi:MAG: VOC family protein [Hyphomicrobiales bacterium]
MNIQFGILFYVADPLASAAFYERVLGKPALESSPGFAMFDLPGGVMLGLWNRKGVLPMTPAQPGASELSFHVPGNADVDAMFADWTAKKFKIIQQPQQMDFGYTFTAEDLDGHRLRVFAAS